MLDSDHQSVAVAVLDAHPSVHFVPKGGAAFDLGEDRYQDAGLGYHNGFYDFLRSRTGLIIGVRLMPTPDAEALLTKEISPTEFLHFAPDGQLRVLLIFWAGTQAFDPEISSDQCFGDNTLYRGERSGRLAITFGIDLLPPKEKTSLISLANR
jgi:hypothetical protein